MSHRLALRLVLPLAIALAGIAIPWSVQAAPPTETAGVEAAAAPDGAGVATLLHTVDYIYRLDDDTIGGGTYSLHDTGVFTTTEGGGGVWQFVPLLNLIVIQHDPGSSCTALALGLQVGPDALIGLRLCFDHTARRGTWAGHITPQTLAMMRQHLGQDVAIPAGIDVAGFLREYRPR